MIEIPCNSNLSIPPAESFDVSTSLFSKGGSAQCISCKAVMSIHPGAWFWFPSSCETETALHFMKEGSIYEPRIHFKLAFLTLHREAHVNEAILFPQFNSLQVTQNISKLTTFNGAQKIVKKTPPNLTYIMVKSIGQLLDNTYLFRSPKYSSNRRYLDITACNLA